MRPYFARSIAAGFATCLALQITELRQPAIAQYNNGLEFIQPRYLSRGSRLEYDSPTGIRCRFTNTERPSLSVGGGIAQPPILNGIQNQDTIIKSELADPQPIVGIVLRIPLGTDQENCNAILRVENAKHKLLAAQEMFALGLITKDQLQVVADKTYAIINDERT
jgi:hypothetical protein